MALLPGERYATPRALADDIEQWMADEPVSRPARAAGRARRPVGAPAPDGRRGYAAFAGHGGRAAERAERPDRDWEKETF
jgi:hypothetical protein